MIDGRHSGTDRRIDALGAMCVCDDFQAQLCCFAKDKVEFFLRLLLGTYRCII